MRKLKTPIDTERVRSALRRLDRWAYGRKMTLSAMRAMLARDTGQEVPRKVLQELSNQCCWFWLKDRGTPRRCSRKLSKLPWDDWEKILDWIRRHRAGQQDFEAAHELIDLKLDTVDSVARRMREDGIRTSFHTTMEALQFLSIDLSGNPRE